jgi:hypothetical protein
MMKLLLLPYYAKASKGRLLKDTVNAFKYKSRRAVLDEQHIAGHLMVQSLPFVALAE